MKKQLVTFDEAQVAEKQHKKPCSDCPWSRQSLSGWLGDLSIEEWLQAAHSEALIECHTLIGAQCAGAAIYRKNVAKLPHRSEILLLPADRERVFSKPSEFMEHHKRGPK